MGVSKIDSPANTRAMTAGDLVTLHSDLEDKGSRERSEGAVQEKLGQARRKVGELLHGAAESIKK